MPFRLEIYNYNYGNNSSEVYDLDVVGNEFHLEYYEDDANYNKVVDVIYYDKSTKRFSFTDPNNYLVILRASDPTIMTRLNYCLRHQQRGGFRKNKSKKRKIKNKSIRRKRNKTKRRN